VIGRLFGRKPNDDEAARSADRLITSREPSPATPPEARANDARIDAALDAAVDTVSLSPIAQVLPTVLATAPAPPAAALPGQHTGPHAPAAPDSARSETGELRPASGGRDGGADPWLADAFAMLLAEEQGEAPATLYGGSYGLSEADLDRIAARVVDRLSRGALGGTVTRIVMEVSERLVREEIDRIRQSAAGAASDPRS
jgi:hypothetical protein